MAGAEDYLPRRKAAVEEPGGDAESFLPPRKEPEKSGAGQAFFLGGGQGATFATADEGTGVVAGLIEGTRPGRWLGEKMGLLSRDFEGNLRGGGDDARLLERADGTAAPGATFSEAYRSGTSSARADLEQSRKDHPVITTGAEIATSLVNPVKLGPTGGATAAGRVLRTGARGAAEGATYAAGASTEGSAGGILRDTLKGGIVGGAAGTAGALVGEGVKIVGQGRVDRLEKRILNEAAEGDPGSRPANLTNRRKLEKAETNIVNEVVHGPDGKAVRKAIQSPPKEAIEQLQPIIDKVDNELDRGYSAFEKAGKATVDTGDYGNRLYQKLLQAKTLPEKRGLERLINDFNELVERNQGAPVSLRDLRAHTTSIQDIHESVLGITPTAAGKLKGKLSAAATEAMDDSLDAAAAGNPQLQAAAAHIRAHNQRMNALLTLKRVKTTQLGGEATGKDLLMRAAQRAGSAVTVGGISAAAAGFDDPEKAIKAGLTGAAVGALSKAPVAAARAIGRGVTTRAIEAARRAGTTKLPAPSLGANAAEIAARGMSRNAVQALARLTLGQGSAEEAKAAGASDEDIRMAERAAARRKRQN